MTGGSWRQFFARAAVLGGVVFVAVRAANAEQGGRSRDALTVTGTLTGVTGTPALAFTLRKGSATCPVTGRNVVVNGSAFSAEVPLESCPAFFDGSDVTVDVSVNGTPVVTGSAVNPVPYARYADQVGTPECPVGYERFSDAATVSPSWVVCRRTRGSVVIDEMVRVGDGATAFWIDRYEATVFSTRVGPAGGTRLFGNTNDFPSTFPRNGQWRPAAFANPPPVMPSPSAFALSRAGEHPAVYITWFQAQEACRASGKRLATGEEWLAAAQGTSDPGSNDGATGRCNTNSQVAIAGSGNIGGAGIGCRSGWGAQDMIGSVWEWTADWVAGAGSTELVNQNAQPWPADYNNDSSSNVFGFTDYGGANTRGLPAAVRRGGSQSDGTRAGVFSVDLTLGPSAWNAATGFRCVIPR